MVFFGIIKKVLNQGIRTRIAKPIEMASSEIGRDSYKILTSMNVAAEASKVPENIEPIVDVREGQIGCNVRFVIRDPSAYGIIIFRSFTKNIPGHTRSNFSFYILLIIIPANAISSIPSIRQYFERKNIIRISPIVIGIFPSNLHESKPNLSSTNPRIKSFLLSCII